MEKIQAKGEAILQLTTICGKLETAREKTQPFAEKGPVKNMFELHEVPTDGELSDFKKVSNHNFFLVEVVGLSSLTILFRVR